jgi:hypothetical protein
MRGGIDPDRAAAHRDDTGQGEASAEIHRDLHPRARRAPRPDDGDSVITVIEDTAAHEHGDRRIREAQERRAVVGIAGAAIRAAARSRPPRIALTSAFVKNARSLSDPAPPLRM